MKINKLYTYPKSMRSVINGGRHYDIDGDKLPSVTTILSATQSPEKKASLDAWKAKMGDKIADQIRDRAAARGTAMHTYLEHYLDGTGYKDLTPLGRQAETMANKIIETGLGDLEELWGLETTLYYPDLYAGATDVVGVYGGQPAIIDFKQSNKPKRREWIQDYFEQLGAYTMEHNQVYGTKIQSGIILMCSKDNLFQKFEVSGREFQKYKHQFLRKIDQYYKIVSGSKGCADTKNGE
jgi:genome maintenance exonuclease 1